MRIALVGVLLTSAVAGCATGANLERDSARAIQPTPYPDSVKISDVRHGLYGSKWVATTPKAVYDCSLEAGERTPLCAKRESPR